MLDNAKVGQNCSTHLILDGDGVSGKITKINKTKRTFNIKTKGGLTIKDIAEKDLQEVYGS
ncbi:gp19 [Sphingomonas phage PAU]|uniref:gp19 n=1 Tax=Sphingomonas phage PAU TaxID=1150991 RepID=UPI0002573118|nr:gp19 [Sphingomonas phage PAU]AFF28017.1 gp19 [Sphingomonas phage PAU]